MTPRRADAAERVRTIVELILQRLDAVYQVLFAVRHVPPQFSGGTRRHLPEQNDRIVAYVLAGVLGAAPRPGELPC